MKLLINDNLKLTDDDIKTLVSATPYDIESVAKGLGLNAWMDDNDEWSIDGDEVGGTYYEVDNE